MKYGTPSSCAPSNSITGYIKIKILPPLQKKTLRRFAFEKHNIYIYIFKTEQIFLKIYYIRTRSVGKTRLVIVPQVDNISIHERTVTDSNYTTISNRHRCRCVYRIVNTRDETEL